MTALAIIAVALTVLSIVAGSIVAWFWERATRAEADRISAEREAGDAKREEAYAKIATDGRTADDTAGVLDSGKFFLPANQDLHPGGAEGCGGRNQGGQEPHP